MPDAIDRYIDDVLEYADLAREDRRVVRAELNEHLQTLFTDRLSLDKKETQAMIEHEFGKASIVGRGIAGAKGRLRTYWKKQRRRLPITVPVALVLAFTVHWAVAESFYAAGTGGEPAIPQGSRILVYKLARTFNSDDVIVFRAADGNHLGIVQRHTPDGLVVSRHGQPDSTVPLDHVVGRVFLNTR